MKRTVLLLSLLMWVAAIATAQTASHSKLAASGNEVSSQSSGHDLRGCLSGSKGDYTLVDHNGKPHKITGDNHALWDSVGHEVDMTGQLTSSNVFKEAEVTDIASRCWNFHLN